MLFYNREQRASKPTVVLDILLGLSSGHEEILWDHMSNLQGAGGIVSVEREPHLARRHVSHDGVGSRHQNAVWLSG